MTSQADFFTANEAAELIEKVGKERVVEALARLRLFELSQMLWSLNFLHSASWREEVFARANSSNMKLACEVLGLNHQALVGLARKAVERAGTTRPDHQPRHPGAGRHGISAVAVGQLDLWGCSHIGKDGAA